MCVFIIHIILPHIRAIWSFALRSSKIGPKQCDDAWMLHSYLKVAIYTMVKKVFFLNGHLGFGKEGQSIRDRHNNFSMRCNIYFPLEGQRLKKVNWGRSKKSELWNSDDPLCNGKNHPSKTLIYKVIHLNESLGDVCFWVWWDLMESGVGSCIVFFSWGSIILILLIWDKT